MSNREYGKYAAEAVGVAFDLPKRARKAPTSKAVWLLAFDPGETTGWSLMGLPAKKAGSNIFHTDYRDIVQGKRIWQHGQISCGDEDEGFYKIRKLIDAYPDAAVITERFILAAKRSEKSDNLLAPVRLNALIKHHLWLRGKEYFHQTTGVVKPSQTNARLMEFGLYTSEGSLEHARDADRHLLYFIRRCLGKETKANRLRHKAWPHLFNSEGNLLG